jgi:hypothetical protein
MIITDKLEFRTDDRRPKTEDGQVNQLLSINRIPNYAFKLGIKILIIMSVWSS